MVLLVSLTARLVVAQASSAATDAYPLQLERGQTIALCETGTVICPASVKCDDPSIVELGGDQRGALLRGATLGTTLCSAGSASGLGMRRIYRVTGVEKPAR